MHYFACALKAQDRTAQGNALGTNVHFVLSPERAAQVGFVTTHYSAPSGLEVILPGLTQGVALGCHVSGVQPGHMRAGNFGTFAADLAASLLSPLAWRIQPI